jgi:aspartate racemase
MHARDIMNAGRPVKHLGILAHSIEGATLCLRAFCQEGFTRLGPHARPDMTLEEVHQ